MNLDIFKGYYRMIYISFFLILLVVGGMAYWQFQSKVHREETNIQTELDKTAFRIQNLTSATTQYLYTTRHQFDYYLEHADSTKPHFLSHYLGQSINPENEWNYFHTDSLPLRFAKNFGNLTGRGFWNKLSTAQKHEISAVLDAMTLFENASQLVPNFAWTYVSNGLVLGIYPRTLSDKVNASNNRTIKAMKNGKHVHSIIPSTNPKKEVRWIQAYLDPAGKGVMISALIPLYNRERFIGHIGIDVRLDAMGQIIKKSQREHGKTFIINEHEQLIAHPELISKTDTAIKNAKVAFPTELQELRIQELNANEFYDLKGYKVYYNVIPNTRWKQIYVVSHFTFYQHILTELGMGLTLFTIFLVSFILSVIYTRSHFIEPAFQLIQYIQLEKENQAFTAIPENLPRIWQPWFKIVAQIFAQNRLVLKQISEQNENLERLVNERTAELQGKNIELENKQQEILSQNEELQQQQEQITLHRDQIEKSHELLEQKNQRMFRDQQVLTKSYTKIKETQRQLQAQKNVLEDINAQITASILYAKTIQNAVLPFDERMQATFSEYFVIYKPKDIVAGDFYWINKVQEHTIFIVADCTGHGVPGAFMSLIGYSLLNEIINENHVLSPAEILDMLHFSVRKYLKQDQTNNKDGMDIGIVVMDTPENNTRKIIFCGAKIPLYYTDNQEVKKIEGTRKSIGSIQNQRITFENHELTLKTDGILYLGSDGYGDQHGGTKRKRFGQKNLFGLLSKIHHQPLETQKMTLENTLADYQKDQHQRDDITLIGIKI